MAFGLDIYRYQTVTDWGAVKRHTITDAEGKRHSISYIWRKLTDGGGRAVSSGDSQVRGAKSVGIPVGGYHYAQFSPTPERQAEVFVAECRRLGALDLVPMLDLEAPFSPDSRARDFGVRFCRRVKALGLRPGVYMSDSFARVLRPDQWDTKPVIWIARYGAKPAYGGRYDVHQYSSSGRVAGISGSVDLNWAYTNAHFMTGGGSAAPAAPAPKPAPAPAPAAPADPPSLLLKEDSFMTLLPYLDGYASVSGVVPERDVNMVLHSGFVDTEIVHVKFFDADGKFVNPGGNMHKGTLRAGKPWWIKKVPDSAVSFEVFYKRTNGHHAPGVGFRRDYD